jgi:hypothetical protein
MNRFLKVVSCAVVLGAATPALAQEVLVTAQRRDFNASESGYFRNRETVATGRPVIVLKRTADYVVLTARIVGDTRDMKQRRADLQATIRNAIDLATKSGVELATGDYLVKPLTRSDDAALQFSSDGRPDTDQATFLIKTRLTAGTDLAVAGAKLRKFMDSVPKVGRSTIVVSGEPTLSVVDPDQYRPAIIDLIAADARASAAKFGPAYGVQVVGLDRPVEWSRAGPTEVFLYLMSSYTVTRD